MGKVIIGFVIGFVIGHYLIKLAKWLLHRYKADKSMSGKNFNFWHWLKGLREYL